MRLRRLAIAILVFLAVALFAVWRVGYHGLDPRLIVWPPPEDSFEPPAALEETSFLNVKNIPLRLALSLLADRHNVTIELDDLALQDRGLTGNEKVTCRISDVTLKQVLEALLSDYNFSQHSDLPRGNSLIVLPEHNDFDIRWRDGRICITTADTWNDQRQNYIGHVHRLDRLLAASHPLVNEQELAEIIESRIINSPRFHGNQHGVIRALPGAIVVSHTPDVQARIADFLERLGDLAEAPDPVALAASWKDRERATAVGRALDKTTDIEVTGVSLQDVCAELSRDHAIPIYLDAEALAKLLLGAETPVTCKLKGISLRSALRVMLKPYDLTFIVKDGALVFTSLGVASTRETLGLFPVGDLANRDDPTNWSSLRWFIPRAIEPNHLTDYSEREGNNVIGGVLVVLNTEEILAQIEAILADLRRARLPPALAGSPPARSASVARFEQALARPVSFAFDQTPLVEVASRLSAQCGINIILDAKEIDRAGDGPDTLVTYQAQDLPLEQALRDMLVPNGLMPGVFCECVEITSVDAAWDRTVARCYPIGRLLPSAHRLGRPEGDEVESFLYLVSQFFGSSSGKGSIESHEHTVVAPPDARGPPATGGVL